MKSLTSVTCALCGSTNHEFLCENSGFRVVRCPGCSLVFVNPQPTEAELKQLYSKEEVFTDGPKSSYLATEAKLIGRLWDHRLRSVERFKTGETLLDVGCGTGDFILLAKNQGWQVTGTELSTSSAAFVERHHGIPVLTFDSSLSQLALTDDSFDVITAWHVVEHLPSPREELGEMFRLLKPGGMLVVEVPNLDYWARKSYMEPLSVQMHLYHFSVRTMVRLLSDIGYRVVRIEVVDPWYGLTDNMALHRAKVLAYGLFNMLFRLSSRNLGYATRVFATN